MNKKNELTTLSLGGGIQSSTIAEMIVEGELPPVDLAIFANTGDDPDYVHEQIAYLKNRLGSVNIPLAIVNNGNIIESIFQKKGRFASIPCYTRTDGKIGTLRRQCTREYKIEPIEKCIRKHLLKMGTARKYSNGAIHVNKNVEITTLIGFSLDEATRMRDSRTKWINNEWPLIGKRMSRYSCSVWLKEKSLPIPEKSACRICPFHNKKYWKNMKENYPKDWSHVVKVDEFLREKNNFTAGMKGEMFLYREAIPLKDVDFSEDTQQMNFIDDLCADGYCFL